MLVAIVQIVHHTIPLVVEEVVELVLLVIMLDHLLQGQEEMEFLQ
jgi:hypothetical protein